MIWKHAPLRFQVHQSRVPSCYDSACGLSFVGYKSQDEFPEHLQNLIVHRYTFTALIATDLASFHLLPSHYPDSPITSPPYDTMHSSTSTNLSRASVMFITSFAFFASVCIGAPVAGSSGTLSVPFTAIHNGC